MRTAPFKENPSVTLNLEWLPYYNFTLARNSGGYYHQIDSQISEIFIRVCTLLNVIQ